MAVSSGPGFFASFLDLSLYSNGTKSEGNRVKGRGREELVERERHTSVGNNEQLVFDNLLCLNHRLCCDIDSVSLPFFSLSFLR